MSQPLFFENHEHLAIHAKDPEGVAHLSVYVQDALFAPQGIDFNPERQHVRILLNRFRWEQEPHIDEQGQKLYARAHSALVFHHVTNVHHQGWGTESNVRMIAILSISYEEGCYYLRCSGGITFRIQASAVEAYILDLDDHWPTSQMPDHGLE
jgi:hypothetical protein